MTSLQDAFINRISAEAQHLRERAKTETCQYSWVIFTHNEVEYCGTIDFHQDKVIEVNDSLSKFHNDPLNDYEGEIDKIKRMSVEGLIAPVYETIDDDELPVVASSSTNPAKAILPSASKGNQQAEALATASHQSRGTRIPDEFGDTETDTYIQMNSALRDYLLSSLDQPSPAKAATLPSASKSI